MFQYVHGIFRVKILHRNYVNEHYFIFCGNVSKGEILHWQQLCWQPSSSRMVFIFLNYVSTRIKKRNEILECKKRATKKNLFFYSSFLPFFLVINLLFIFVQRSGKTRHHDASKYQTNMSERKSYFWSNKKKIISCVRLTSWYEWWIYFYFNLNLILICVHWEISFYFFFIYSTCRFAHFSVEFFFLSA